MTTYNIYACYNFSYDFATHPLAYVNIDNFSPTLDPSVFEFSYPQQISSIRVKIGTQGVDMSNLSIHASVTDTSGNIIQGDEGKGPDISILDSIYTFTSLLPANTTICFQVLGAGFVNVIDFLYCNIEADVV